MDVSFFGEMAWKSALISGAALALAFVLRSRAAADRALVLRLGVFMLLLLPFISLVLPALKIEAWAAPPPPALPPLDAAPALSAADLAYALPADPGLQPAEPTIWDDPTPLVLLAYLGGLAMVGSRLLAGLFLLRRWTRAGTAYHHLIDPRTGAPATSTWVTASCLGTTSVAANTASTAAIVLGEGAAPWLSQRRLPARLVDLAGSVVHVGGWPEEAAA